MPFFRFHFVEAARLTEVRRQMTDRIQQVVGCPREHIVFELIHSCTIEEIAIKTDKSWPFVEVVYFERSREIQHEVARIIADCLKMVGYMDTDINF